jgi:hypothetical protein
MAEKESKVEVKKQETMFTKEQILASKRYSNRRDALGAILADGESYTFEKVDVLLDKFMKGKVK